MARSNCRGDCVEDRCSTELRVIGGPQCPSIESNYVRPRRHLENNSSDNNILLGCNPQVFKLLEYPYLGPDTRKG